jgi:hypothetical protein
MPFAHPRKHLTTAQRIRAIEYVKAEFQAHNDTTYVVPNVPMEVLAANTGRKVGAPLTVKQFNGVLKLMQEMGYEFIRPRVERKPRPAMHSLQARIEALEKQVADLQGLVNRPTISDVLEGWTSTD